MTERTAYLVAAGMFALIAGIQVGSGGGLGLSAVLLLVPVVLLAWLGIRGERRKPS